MRTLRTLLAGDQGGSLVQNEGFGDVAGDVWGTVCKWFLQIDGSLKALNVARGEKPTVTHSEVTWIVRPDSGLKI